MKHQLEFTLYRFEERFAIIHNEKIGEIKWPISNLPEDINPGDKFQLKAISPETQEFEQTIALQKTLESLIN